MLKRLTTIVSSALTLPIVAFAPMVSAAEAITVTPANTQGWTTADTRPGGSVNFVSDVSAPLGAGALQLTTDGTTTSKAQYMHVADGLALADVTDLSYQTRQVSGPAHAAASYQLVIDLNGNDTSGGFATLVYEPYQNGAVTNDDWQTWDVGAGQFWATRTFTDGANCSTTNGAGGAPFYTLATLTANCPDAVVNGYGVNIGSNNPSYNVETDAFNFNGLVYNFEPTVSVADKEGCKNDGWKASNTPTYKNQGDCVSSFASQGKAKGNPVVNFFRDLL